MWIVSGGGDGVARKASIDEMDGTMAGKGPDPRKIQ